MHLRAEVHDVESKAWELPQLTEVADHPTGRNDYSALDHVPWDKLLYHRLYQLKDIPRPYHSSWARANVISSVEGLHMLFHAYSSSTGLRRTEHNQQKQGTFDSLGDATKTIGFSEFGRVCADFKLFRL